jgi:hypothetical protein
MPAMSMHEIEHLVQGSIQHLDAQRAPDDDTVRDLIGALYRFEHWFDCGSGLARGRLRRAALPLL